MDETKAQANKISLPRIKVWFFIVLFLTPIIFAAPPPMSWRPFHYADVPLGVDLSSGSPQAKTPFSIPNKIEALGESLFSSLLGIETESMPVHVCMSNTSEIIYSGGKTTDSRIFLNEGGRADIYVRLHQDETDLLTKVPLASTTCATITAKLESGLGNEITWQVKPTQQLENILFSMTANFGFSFKWGTYIRNYLILLGGWIILLASLIQVFQFLKKDSDNDIYPMDNTNRKILEYLTEKDKASETAVINETFQGLGVTKEEYIHRLKALQANGFIRYERPFGNGAFIYITDNGRFVLEPFPKKVGSYLTRHFLEILILLVALLTLWATT